MSRKLDPANFAYLMVTARNNGGLPCMAALMAQALRENGFERGAQIYEDALLFEQPAPEPLVYCDNCGDEVLEG